MTCQIMKTKKNLSKDKEGRRQLSQRVVKNTPPSNKEGHNRCHRIIDETKRKGDHTIHTMIVVATIHHMTIGVAADDRIRTSGHHMRTEAETQRSAIETDQWIGTDIALQNQSREDPCSDLLEHRVLMRMVMHIGMIMHQIKYEVEIIKSNEREKGARTMYPIETICEAVHLGKVKKGLCHANDRPEVQIHYERDPAGDPHT